MRQIRNRTSVLLMVLLTLWFVGGSLATPGVGHIGGVTHTWNKHFKPLARRSFYTKVAADTRFQHASATTVPWFKESADSLAADAISERVVFTSPDGVTITSIFVEPAASLTASDVNFATITITRRDADGTDPVTVVSETTQTSASGGTGDWTAFSAVPLGSLSNTALADGQKLTMAISKTAIGVALPVLAVQIEYTVS